MQWSWRQHGIVCAVLVVALLLAGLVGPPGMWVVQAALWLGGVLALSTALIALMRPRPAQAWQGYVIAGLLSVGGLMGLTTLAGRRLTGAPSAKTLAVAEAVSLDALTVDGATASVAITAAAPTRLRHITLRSQDGYCEGTVWPEPAPISGPHTFRVPFRCAGGVPSGRAWRLSTVAEQDGTTATLVWSAAAEAPPGAIVRPLP